MIVGVCSRCGRRAMGSVSHGVFLCLSCTGPAGGPGTPDAAKVKAAIERKAA